MRDYFLTILITSLIGGIVCSVSDSKFEKPIKYLVSLICIVLILSPVSQVFTRGSELEVSLPDVSIDDGYAAEWIMTETENMLKKTISEAVFSKFGFFPKLITLNLTTREGIDGEVTVVENVKVHITGEYEAIMGEISRYLDALLYTETEVVIDNE